MGITNRFASAMETVAAAKPTAKPAAEDCADCVPAYGYTVTDVPDDSSDSDADKDGDVSDSDSKFSKDTEGIESEDDEPAYFREDADRYCRDHRPHGSCCTWASRILCKCPKVSEGVVVIGKFINHCCRVQGVTASQLDIARRLKQRAIDKGKPLFEREALDERIQDALVKLEAVKAKQTIAEAKWNKAHAKEQARARKTLRVDEFDQESRKMRRCEA
jgi:hypothetical protein